MSVPSVPTFTTICCTCPLGFDFDDQRGDKNVKRVIDKKSNARYGYIGNDQNATLRVKFTALFLGQAAFNVVFRMPVRIAKLMEGDFVSTGKKLALQELRTECSRKTKEANAKGAKDGKVIITPAENELRNVTIKKTLWQLAKNIAKLVTYPLAIVGLQLATIYGLINPNGGRAMFAMIEETWAREMLPTAPSHILEIKWSEYLAPCMQPEDIAERDNLFPVTIPGQPYHTDTLRSLMSHLNRKLKGDVEFYKNTGIDVDKLLTTIKNTKAAVSVNGRADLREIENEHLSQTKNEQAVAERLKKIISALYKIEEKWNKVIEGNKEQPASFEADMSEQRAAVEEQVKALTAEMPNWHWKNQ